MAKLSLADIWVVSGTNGARFEIANRRETNPSKANTSRESRTISAHAAQTKGDHYYYCFKQEIEKRSGKDLEKEPKSRISEQCAAIDYVISLNTDVFIPSHRGNIGRAMKGRRVYVGHMKCSRRMHRKLDFLKRNSEV
ncbi:hypothetical protein ACFE04_024999 [Oxalis oulophora]